jgi:hypothetical protein
MRLGIPFVPIELEIAVRRRTRPFQIRVRTLLLSVAVVAITVYLVLPFSPADERLMARYESYGNIDYKLELTKNDVINELGPPASVTKGAPNRCDDYTWVARFDRPMSHQEFELGLSIDPTDGIVLACGLHKTEYQDLELLRFRVRQLLKLDRPVAPN